MAIRGNSNATHTEEKCQEDPYSVILMVCLRFTLREHAQVRDPPPKLVVREVKLYLKISVNL